MEIIKIDDKNGAYDIYVDSDMCVNIELTVDTPDYSGTLKAVIPQDITPKFLRGMVELASWYLEEIEKNDAN